MQNNFTEAMGSDVKDRDRVERAQARQAEWLDKELGTENGKDGEKDGDGREDVNEERGEEPGTAGDDDAMGNGYDGNETGHVLVPQTSGNEPGDPGSHAAAAASSDQPMALDDGEAGPRNRDTQVVAQPKRSSPRKRKQT